VRVAASQLLQEGQGRPHLFCDMRLVDDEGRQLPNDGKAVGHLQASWRGHVLGLWSLLHLL
jgi:hypothetical protein